MNAKERCTIATMIQHASTSMAPTTVHACLVTTAMDTIVPTLMNAVAYRTVAMQMQHAQIPLDLSIVCAMLVTMVMG